MFSMACPLVQKSPSTSGHRLCIDGIGRPRMDHPRDGRDRISGSVGLKWSTRETLFATVANRFCRIGNLIAAEAAYRSVRAGFRGTMGADDRFWIGLSEFSLPLKFFYFQCRVFVMCRSFLIDVNTCVKRIHHLHHATLDLGLRRILRAYVHFLKPTG